MAVVLVEFPCSFNGITSETMVVGSERDFGTMTAGLAALGWVAEGPASREVAVEVVPEVKVPDAIVETPIEAPEQQPVEPTPAAPSRKRR